MSPQYSIFIRDNNLTRVGQLDEFMSLELNMQFNDVGTWVLDMDRRVPMAGLILRPGYGIEVMRNDDTIVFSGPMTSRVRTRTVNDDKLTVSGVDDNVWLKRRLAHPEPYNEYPPGGVYGTSVDYLSTKQTSTILREITDANLGPGASSLRELSPILRFPSDPLLGTTQTIRGRWQNLLTLMQEIALSGGDLGFNITPWAGEFWFNVYKPVDRSGTVQFSIELGNLVGYSYDDKAPELNVVYVGGGGEGLARKIEIRPDWESISEWGGRIEDFQDRRDTTVVAELQQEGTKTLAEGAAKSTLNIEPIDIAGQQYGTHYNLGDIVRVVVDEESITDVVRAVKISLTTAGPQRIIPAIGTPGRKSLLGLWSRLFAAEHRIRQLERR